jgi:hypothetical protein
MLLPFSLVPEDARLGPFPMRPVRLLGDLAPRAAAPRLDGLPGRLDPSELEEAVAAFCATPLAPVPGRTSPVAGPSAPGDGADGGRFLEGLARIRGGGTVHVAYFGDSLIEGDIITRDLRELLQARYGGRGLGFVPARSVVPGFRQTVSDETSPGWRRVTLLDQEAALVTPGVSGEVFLPPDHGPSWLRYTVPGREPGFTSARILHSHAAPGVTVTVSVPGRGPSRHTLGSGPGLRELSLAWDTPQRDLRLDFPAGARLRLYGLSLEDGGGIYLDNLALRGASGTHLSRLGRETAADFDRLLDYRLVVLHFGVNALVGDSEDFSWYERGFTATIRHLKECFPNADLVLAGIIDRAVRREGRYVTNPVVFDFLEMQRRIARREGLLFLDSFQGMGGINSMVSLVEAAPPLAARDYTHLTPGGGRLLARYFMERLGDHYADLERRRLLAAPWSGGG